MTMEQNGCFGYPIVVIPDVQSDVLELILAFMYKGTKPVNCNISYTYLMKIIQA